MRVRRCAGLMFESREETRFALEALHAGGDGLVRERRWIAYAPHLDRMVPLEEHELVALGRVGSAGAVEAQSLDVAADVLEALVAKGLLVDPDAGDSTPERRDAALRAAHWRSTAAVAHVFSRWGEEEVGRAKSPEVPRTLDALVAAFGAPPPATLPGDPSAARVDLPACAPDEFDALAQARTTCRNFDVDVALPLDVVSRVLHRSLRAHAVVELAPGAAFLKRNFPSGGGLHPLEAILVVRRCEGVSPGLWRYDAVAHALEAVDLPSEPELDRIAAEAVARQSYFADAPILVVLAARFARTQWKYRDHGKAHRVMVLEAGHAAQLVQLAATELGLGAFVTAAIGERQVEAAFGIDYLELGVLAVLGFGARAARIEQPEFDPLGRVPRRS